MRIQPPFMVRVLSPPSIKRALRLAVAARSLQPCHRARRPQALPHRAQPLKLQAHSMRPRSRPCRHPVPISATGFRPQMRRNLSLQPPSLQPLRPPSPPQASPLQASPLQAALPRSPARKPRRRKPRPSRPPKGRAGFLRSLAAHRQILQPRRRADKKPVTHLPRLPARTAMAFASSVPRSTPMNAAKLAKSQAMNRRMSPQGHRQEAPQRALARSRRSISPIHRPWLR